MKSQAPAHSETQPNTDALGIVEADLTERVADAMRKASRAYVATLLQALAAKGYDGLTPASLSLLARVPSTGARTVDLARETGRTKQATGKIVMELEAHGYVQRGPDPADGRAQLVRQTDRSSAALAEGVNVKADLSKKAGAVLSAEALVRLYGDLSRLEAAITLDRKK